MVVAEAEAVHLVPSPGSFSCIPCGAQVNVPAANSASQRVAAIDNGWIACSARGLVRSTGVLSAAAGAATLVASFRSGAEGYIAAAVGGDVIVEVAATGELVAGNPSWSGPIDDAAELRWHASEPSCVVRVRTGALSLIDVASGGKSWSGKTIPSDAWDGGLSVCSVAWSPLAGKKLLACGLGAGASTAWGGTFKIERNEVRCGSIVVIDLERGAPIARFGCPLFYSGTSSSPHPAGVVAASCETIRWVPRGVEGSTIFAGYVTHCPANDADWGDDDDTPPRDGITIRPIHRAEPSMDPYRQVNRTAAPTLCALEPRGQLDSVGDSYVDDFLFPLLFFLVLTNFVFLFAFLHDSSIARATIFYGLAQPFASAAQREEYYTALLALERAGDLNETLDKIDEGEADVSAEELESELYGAAAVGGAAMGGGGTVWRGKDTAEEGAPFAMAFSAKLGVLAIASTAQPGVECAARVALVRYVDGASDASPRWTSEQLWSAHPKYDGVDGRSVTVADLCGGASAEMRTRLKTRAPVGLAVLDGDTVLLCAVDRATNDSSVCVISLVKGDEAPRSLPPPVASATVAASPSPAAAAAAAPAAGGAFGLPFTFGGAAAGGAAPAAAADGFAFGGAAAGGAAPAAAASAAAATTPSTAALPPTPRALTWAKEHFTADAAALFDVPYERARAECARDRVEHVAPMRDSVRAAVRAATRRTAEASLRLDELASGCARVGDEVRSSFLCVAPILLFAHSSLFAHYSFVCKIVDDHHRARGEARCAKLEQLLCTVTESSGREEEEEAPLDCGWQSLQLAVSRRERRIRLALSVLEVLQREEHVEADALLGVVGGDRTIAHSPRRGMRDRIAKRRCAERRMLDQLTLAAPLSPRSVNAGARGKKNLRLRLEALAPLRNLGAAGAAAAPSSARSGEQRRLVAKWLRNFGSAPPAALRDVKEPKLEGPPPSRAAHRDARELSMQYLSVSTPPPPLVSFSPRPVSLRPLLLFTLSLLVRATQARELIFYFFFFFSFLFALLPPLRYFPAFVLQSSTRDRRAEVERRARDCATRLEGDLARRDGAGASVLTLDRTPHSDTRARDVRQFGGGVDSSARQLGRALQREGVERGNTLSRASSGGRPRASRTSRAATVRPPPPGARVDDVRDGHLLYTVTFYANHAHNLTRSP
jgi:hypothetical protein